MNAAKNKRHPTPPPRPDVCFIGGRKGRLETKPEEQGTEERLCLLEDATRGSQDVSAHKRTDTEAAVRG